ncbi:LONRF3 LON peptidase N-terminal domain and ring finger 3 [Clonorchis sinensis]|uniref:LONRF3 LON peptidase N-terminal domain and ring finger 3 n=1 Tax=Clonorchis sinensis TaxID=79923 RepID=G7YU23_CLOSI|nr:LONRF3 LON peptidase N-terminal domain and ring finger 3 [Clonorchis sinensis]
MIELSVRRCKSRSRYRSFCSEDRFAIWLQLKRGLCFRTVPKIILKKIAKFLLDCASYWEILACVRCTLSYTDCRGIEKIQRMTTPSVDVVHLTETFIKVPCFALAYGAFSKLYENEGYVANQKPVLLSKLLALCTTLYKSQRVAANLLKQTELETTKSLKTILSCSLCHRLYLQPVVLFCGHTFCRNCVEGSFKCHACTECTTTGEVNDSLLITRSISHFYPDTIPLYDLLRKSTSMVRQGKYKEALELNDELLANCTKFQCNLSHTVLL